MPLSLDLLKRYFRVRPATGADAAPFQQEALKHLTALYNFALGLARNQDDAADLVQETYFRALRFQHRFQPGTNLRAWLFKILRNAFIDSRWRRRRESVTQDPDLEISSHLQVQGARERGEAPGAANRLLRLDLREALEQLPDPFRTAILLSDVEGLSVEEIAEIMDCPKNTVKTRLFRGRTLLREWLRDYGN